MTTIELMIIMILGGAIIGALMVLYDKLKTARSQKLIRTFTSALADYYLPRVSDMIIKTTIKMVDKTLKKVPEWTDSVKTIIKQTAEDDDCTDY